MNERKYRTYTQEFKLEALSLMEHSGKSMGAIERELGITPGLLAKWRSRYQIKAEEPDKLQPSDISAAQAEIRRLRRELAVAQEERDILKKAIAIFSQNGGRDTHS